jgi:uncharacterized protein YkwD
MIMTTRKLLFASGGLAAALALVGAGYMLRGFIGATDVARLTGDALSRTTELFETIQRETVAPPPLIRREEAPGARLTREGVLSWTNSHRAAAGLPPLAENATLDTIATARLDDMFAKQYFDHVSPTGESVSTVAGQDGYAYLRIGENIALGNFANDEDLVQAWMDSPGHRANILNDRYTEIGIAVGEGTYEGKSAWIGVQVFGLPRDACPAPDADLKDQIDSEKSRLSALDAQATDLRSRIEALGKPQTKAEVAYYNEQVDAYNALIQQMNALLESVRGQIETYNDQVRALNQCIESGQ